MDEKAMQYEDLKLYMENEYGITPENIDQKLRELKKQVTDKLNPGTFRKESFN